MKQSDINEYRKLSAEKLGLELINGRVAIRDKSGKNMPNKYNAKGEWHPDKDANQMLMVLRQVLKSGWQVHMFAEENGEYWTRFKCIDKETIQEFSDTLEKAFAKAFLEYDKQQ